MGYLEDELIELKKSVAEIKMLLTEKQKESSEKILDQADLLRMLNVSRRTLSTWREEGKIEYSQIAGKIYYTEKSVLEFLEKYKVKSFKK